MEGETNASAQQPPAQEMDTNASAQQDVAGMDPSGDAMGGEGDAALAREEAYLAQ